MELRNNGLAFSSLGLNLSETNDYIQLWNLLERRSLFEVVGLAKADYMAFIVEITRP